jgi:hypothetical protein
MADVAKLVLLQEPTTEKDMAGWGQLVAIENSVQNHQALQLRSLHNCCTVTVPANNSNMTATLGDACPYSQPTAAMQWLVTGKACRQQSLRRTTTSPQPEYAHEYSRNLIAQHKG